MAWMVAIEPIIDRQSETEYKCLLLKFAVLISQPMGIRFIKFVFPPPILRGGIVEERNKNFDDPMVLDQDMRKPKLKIVHFSVSCFI